MALVASAPSFLEGSARGLVGRSSAQECGCSRVRDPRAGTLRGPLSQRRPVYKPIDPADLANGHATTPNFFSLSRLLANMRSTAFSVTPNRWAISHCCQPQAA